MQEMQGVVRGLADNFIYHIINRGNGRQEVFHKEKDYEAFIEIMKEAKERPPVKLLSYCLMPNHAHLLITTPYEELTKLMHYIGSTYGSYLRMLPPVKSEPIRGSRMNPHGAGEKQS
jgi:REP element-mobilizing transposase RayT